uniref:NADH-ubiquinone oxidoreductase chain 4L n=1 Tax=Symphylella sp. YG-2006 TaxID=390856 RepID=B7S771_9MYRI|nr:NADH dehydrogenase subunit 4L [Symphylella sp. YG-2006]ABQ01740.1 NADH dehydrogenase subunit 4L [Symphylella sp. YG-2006]
MYFVVSLGVIGGIYSFTSNRRHILMSLMSLEFISMMLFLMLMINFSFGGFDAYLGVIYLAFSACEGAFGLGVIVFVVRGFGNDLFSASGIVQC